MFLSARRARVILTDKDVFGGAVHPPHGDASVRSAWRVGRGDRHHTRFHLALGVARRKCRCLFVGREGIEAMPEELISVDVYFSGGHRGDA